MKELFEKHFSIIEDERCECDVKHKLTDVLIIVMCSVICGLDELDDIVEFSNQRSEFFLEHFGIEKIPSKSTLTRILSMVKGDVLGTIIVKIMQELLGSNEEVIAIDGKTICSTAKKNSGRKKIHIVTAYLTGNGVALGQMSVDTKTNEIPVVRELLELINIEGKIVTADAMHCQKETIRQIIDNNGDYVLGLKENQKNFYDDIKLFIDDCISSALEEMETAQTNEKSRNRFEARTCYKSPTLDWLSTREEWAGLTCAFAVHRKTVVGDKISEETSYYITSLDVPAEKLLEIVREHWKIESMHWQLDVVFGEDDCRIFSKNGQENMNIFRKYALAMHKNYIARNKCKVSMKNNMLKCLLNQKLLLDVIKVGL